MLVPSLPELKPAEVNPVILMLNVKFSLCLPNAAHTHAENEKPPWNAKTAVPSHDFDEWFHMQHRPPRTTDEDLGNYQGSEWRGVWQNFSHPSVFNCSYVSEEQRPKDFIFILFLASSWGRNGEIVSCAHYKY